MKNILKIMIRQMTLSFSLFFFRETQVGAVRSLNNLGDTVGISLLPSVC